MPTIAAILPTDSPSIEQAVRYGKQLTEGLNGELMIIPVYDEDKYSGAVERKAMAGSEVTKLEDVREALSDSTIDAVESVVANSDVRWKVEVFIGSLPSDLISEVEAGDFDHLIVPTEQTSPTGKVIFGDLAQSLVLNTSVPTTVLTKE